MAIPSISPLQAAGSWLEPILPAFSAVCDEAQRRCSTQHSLPVTPSEEMRLRAWELCWLALDAASAPANQLPDIADSQGWPPELIEQLRATPGLPKLNARTWQELRGARDQQLFATLPPQGSSAAEPVANEALAAMLTDGFARLDLPQLRAWITPSVTAAMARWLSAGLLAIDSLALSDDHTDATALELIAFVQGTLQREHGAAAQAADLVQSEPTLAAAASGRGAPEAQREAQPAAAAAHQPAAAAAPLPAAAAAPLPAAVPAPTASAAQPDASDVAVAPRVPESTATIEQTPIAPTRDAARVNVAETVTRPRQPSPRTPALIAGVVAVAALLLLMFRSGSAPSTNQQPPVATPAPSAHVVTPKPLAAEPAPTAPTPEVAPAPQTRVKQPTSTAPQRPRYRTIAAAKRAHSAKKIDDAGYAAAIAELEAVRASRIAKEQLNLRNGKLSQTDYQRRVDAINKNLGFDRR